LFFVAIFIKESGPSAEEIPSDFSLEPVI
jgi:hypothetical protein